jgi:hypothetical protein
VGAARSIEPRAAAAPAARVGSVPHVGDLLGRAPFGAHQQDQPSTLCAGVYS